MNKEHTRPWGQSQSLSIPEKIKGLDSCLGYLHFLLERLEKTYNTAESRLPEKNFHEALDKGHEFMENALDRYAILRNEIWAMERYFKAKMNEVQGAGFVKGVK